MTCGYCGEEERLELLEVWSPEEWLVETCCEELEAQLRDGGLEELSRERWKALFEEAGISVRAVWPEPGRGGFVADHGLELGPISQAEAKAFVREHHRHRKNPPAGWRWGHGLYGQRGLVGVAMVGRAVAAALDPAKVVEVNRVCVRELEPRGLAWNACSMLYGAAVREARRRGFELVVTYTQEGEPGTTLKASGFRAVAKVRAQSWSRKSRPREEHGPLVPKIRWERSCA